MSQHGTRRAIGLAMDDVTKAKLQVRLVIATFRQHITRSSLDGDAAAAFPDRARPLLDKVERAHRDEPEVAQLLAEARRELDGEQPAWSAWRAPQLASTAIRK